MPSALSRRQLLTAIASLCATPAFAHARERDVAAALRALEARAGGRLGVGILHAASGRIVGHRLDERFAMCSTFKLPLAGVILHEADAGRLDLEEVLRYTEKDLISHAPVTTTHLREGGMTVAALAEAAQVTSDNLAANLLLKRLGGPAGFTAKLRALGDETTRLDRCELELNIVRSGDVRDTTTPRAMAETVAQFVVGDVLKPASRDRLIAWTIATKTGLQRIRAGLPSGWRAGDKTGTALADVMTDKYNDVAVFWPPDGAAVVVSAYYDTAVQSKTIRDDLEAVLAEVGRIAASTVTPG
ncbi:MAG TPA: class A beta-lactamase [Vicinamibacterales bacterium]